MSAPKTALKLEKLRSGFWCGTRSCTRVNSHKKVIKIFAVLLLVACVAGTKGALPFLLGISTGTAGLPSPRRLLCVREALCLPYGAGFSTGHMTGPHGSPLTLHLYTCFLKIEIGASPLFSFSVREKIPHSSLSECYMALALYGSWERL